MLNEEIETDLRGNLTIRDYIIDNIILSEKDLENICKTTPDLEIRVLSEELDLSLETALRHTYDLFVLPQKSNKDIVVNKTEY